MKIEETYQLVAVARTRCPRQVWGPNAEEEWHRVVGEWPLPQVARALDAVTAESPFADVQVVAEKVRAERAANVRWIDHYKGYPPVELEDDPIGYRAWLLDATRRVADGERYEHVFPNAVPHDAAVRRDQVQRVERALAGAGRRTPAALPSGRGRAR